MSEAFDPEGVLVLDKPADMTSHDVVDRVRRLFRTRRVGHTGTLDPDATGVLVLCVGQATRIADYLSSASKHYSATVLFGVRTDTLDTSGTVIAEGDASALTHDFVLSLLSGFRGRILQMPPMVSARRHEGRRLYELAREGVSVEREAREVLISSLTMTDFSPGPRPTADLEITCSTGTYIRVLADDLGQAAGTGATMQSLRRTWVGTTMEDAFSLAESRTLQELQALSDAGRERTALLTIADALRGMPRFRLDPEMLKRLRHGQAVDLPDALSDSGSGLTAILDEAGAVSAIVRREDHMLHPVKVLASQ